MTGRSDHEDLERRLARFDKKLVRSQSKAEPDDDLHAHRRRQRQRAGRMVSDFIAAILVGAFLGYMIDRVFSLSPFGLVTGVALGFASAIFIITRTASSSE